MSKPKQNHASCYKKNDYDSDEDLEHLMRVTVLKVSKSEKSNSSLSNIENDETICKNGKIRLEIIDQSSINMIRFLNILSIAVLIISFFTTSISKISISNNYDLLMDYLRRDKIQTEGNLLILHIAFLFVTCKIF